MEDKNKNINVDEFDLDNEASSGQDDIYIISDDTGDDKDNPGGGIFDELEDNGDRDESASEKDAFVMPKSKAVLIRKLLRNIKDNCEQVERLLAGSIGDEAEARIGLSQFSDEELLSEKQTGEEKVIEGVFDGEKMIGPDGKQYTVPSNYASKSKLVEGDIMKLTITPNGTFLYKQIGPIERSRLVGELLKDDDGNFYAVVNNKKWRILTASVTYYRGEDGDEVVILVPKNGESRWAAVENIIKK